MIRPTDLVRHHYSGPHKPILRCIADYADQDGGNSYPSIPLIAFETGQSVRNVGYAIPVLEANKVVTVLRTSGRPNVYTIEFTLFVPGWTPATIAPPTPATIAPPPLQRPLQNLQDTPANTPAKSVSHKGRPTDHGLTRDQRARDRSNQGPPHHNNSHLTLDERPLAEIMADTRRILGIPDPDEPHNGEM